jgi:hypothetical protein
MTPQLLRPCDFQRELQAIFVTADPFSPAIRETVEARLLLFPVGPLLDADEFNAISEAARRSGDSSVVVKLLERSRDEPAGWLIDVDDSGGYRVLRPAEVALFSPSGRWGMLFSHERHSVVGGEDGFVENLRALWPDDVDDDVEDFLAYWKEDFGGDDLPAWLRDVLSNVYGSERADEWVRTTLG